MLTRREKLLIRPWQLRRYNNHRKKVLTALPVIDFGPPPRRTHVTLKLKKLQREDERRMKIEEDNFRLLQRMGAIMKKKRLDNYWETKPPNFLRRVGVYHRTRTPSPSDATPEIMTPTLNTRKSRCTACNTQLGKQKMLPEERIPWEPPKKSPSSKRTPTTLAITGTNKHSPVKKEEHSHIKSRSCQSSSKSREKPDTSYTKSREQFFLLPLINPKKVSAFVEHAPEKKIVLEQGSLHLALNFPIYVDVKVKSTKGEMFIQRGYCSCGALEKNIKPTKT